MAEALVGLDISSFLPPSLLLPARLSAHKYLIVCTLTVATWDALVLAPRSWRLLRTKEWSALKITYFALAFLMPAEFVAVAVAFFDTDFTSEQCSKFYLFEPIMSAVVMAIASTALCIRLYAIHDRSKKVLAILAPLLFLQVAAQSVGSGFYRVVPLKVGQGCLSGPKYTWVGIYWIAPTLLYAAIFVLAVLRAKESLIFRPLGVWKLTLRDNLNVYGALLIVNLINVVFWFSVTPNDESDAIRTICTSMIVALTTTMTQRIILNVRGSLVSGGAYSGATTSHNVNSNNRGPVSFNKRASQLHQTSTNGRGQISAIPTDPIVIDQNQMMNKSKEFTPSVVNVAGEPSGDTQSEKGTLGDTNDEPPYPSNSPLGGIKITVDRQYS